MNALLPDSFREFAAARGEAVPDELIVDGFAGGGGASVTAILDEAEQ